MLWVQHNHSFQSSKEKATSVGVFVKTLLRSQDLWDLVEQGYVDPDDEGKLRENRKKDSKALVIIQQAVHDSVFSRIATATTSKQAWLILQKAFQGDSRVLMVKLQSLRRDFETLMMKNGESIADFLSRATTIISQMQTYGETIKDQTIVEKVLRSLTPKFDHVVAAIEESKNLFTFTFIELMGSLEAHESRINRSMERNEEKAFQVKDAVPKYNDSDRVMTRGRGRGGYRGRGHGTEKGCNRNEAQRQFGVQSSNKANIQCYHCKKFGHVKADCWYKNQRANFAAENEASENNGNCENKLFMTNIPSDQKTAEVWFIDSSCSNHMTGLKPVFKELNEGEKLKVKLRNGKELQVEGKGTVVIETHHGNRILTNVQYVPDIGYNLLSVGQLMESGYSILFDDGACLIKNKQTGRVLAKVKMTQSKMFPLEVSNVESFALTATATNTTKNNSELWHLRYGHLNIKGLSLLNQRDMVIGLPKISAINICEGCVYGKQTRKSFPIGKAWRASKCLELIHAGLCGPMQTKSFGRSFYFLIFIDDYSRMSWIYFLESKSETFEKFKHFKAKVEKQSGMFIKSLRSDRGREFLSNNFNHFCKEHGIHRELTTPYTPEQNGVAERKNQTVVEMARSMLQMKGLLNDFWAEAVSISIYLLNISPTKAVMNKTPFEVWYGKKPNVSHLRVFCCISYALVPSQVRQKLDKKSEKCIFVGYCTQSKAYRLYNPLNGKILTRRDVVFDESASWDWKNSEEYVSLVDGELTNDGEQTVFGSSTPPSSTPSTPQSYHSS
ncbi:hypothetical protein IC575_003732 [Cucumis melo]